MWWACDSPKRIGGRIEYGSAQISELLVPLPVLGSQSVARCDVMVIHKCGYNMCTGVSVGGSSEITSATTTTFSNCLCTSSRKPLYWRTPSGDISFQLCLSGIMTMFKLSLPWRPISLFTSFEPWNTQR